MGRGKLDWYMGVGEGTETIFADKAYPDSELFRLPWFQLKLTQMSKQTTINQTYV